MAETKPEDQRAGERADSAAPEFVVVGTITLDRVGDSYLLGGTTSYAALTARRLGYRAAIVTAGAPAETAVLRSEGILISSAPSPTPTIFENIYQHGHRQQFLRSRADDVPASAIPERWREAPVVHLGPLTQEVAPELALCFPCSLIGATPQGWLRRWDSEGRVTTGEWVNAETTLQRIDALVFSEQDVSYDQALIEHYVSLARLAVLTRGAAGCTVYAAGSSCHLPAYPANEVEPTGAGDVFACAFFLKLRETNDACAAADWANCVASFVVEAPGTSGIPTLAQVRKRFALGHG